MSDKAYERFIRNSVVNVDDRRDDMPMTTAECLIIALAALLGFFFGVALCSSPEACGSLNTGVTLLGFFFGVAL